MAPTEAVEGTRRAVLYGFGKRGREFPPMSTDCSDEPDAEAQERDRQSAAADTSPRLWSKEYRRLLVVQFMSGLGFSTFYLLPKYLKCVHRASAAAIGQVMGVALLAAVAATPLAAIWLARGRRRSPAVISLAMLAGCALAFAFVDRIGLVMLLLRVAQGAAASVLMITVVTRAAEIVPSHRLGQAIGYLGVAGLITNALSPVLAEPFAELLGWPAAFVLAALWCIAGATAAFYVEDAPSTAAVPMTDLRRIVTAPLRSILYAGAICGVAFGVMFTYTQPLAMQRGAQHVGLFFSGFAVLACSVRLLIGDIADRVGRKSVSMLATLGYSLVVLATAWVTPHSLFWAGAGLGLAHGLLYPALNALAFEMSEARHRGVVAAAFSGAFNLGHALSVLNLGFVADAWGLPSIFVGAATLTMTGAWALANVQGRRTSLTNSSA